VWRHDGHGRWRRLLQQLEVEEGSRVGQVGLSWLVVWAMWDESRGGKEFSNLAADFGS
jgi:hypothetical protein